MLEANRVTEMFKGGFDSALKKDMTKDMSLEFQLVGNNDQNQIISMEGPQGGGKSYAILFLSEEFADITGMELTIDDVHFSISNLYKDIRKNHRRRQILRDEQVETYGMGTGAEKEMLLSVEKIIRKFKMCFWNISPEFVKHHFHYHMMTWEMGSDMPIDTSKPLEGQWKFTKSILFNRIQYPFGYVITGTPKRVKFIKEYEKKKGEFIDALFEGTISNREKYLYECAEELSNNKKFMEKFEKMTRHSVKRHWTAMHLGIGFTKDEKNTVSDMIAESIFKISGDPSTKLPVRYSQY